MILLRAIKGDNYAKKIEDGIISLRDVLSTITNDIETGYEYSNYNEKYFQSALITQLQPPVNISEFNEKIRSKLLLTFNRTVPYIYLTYFHILNENSVRDWLDNTSDDMSYIFIEPKLDSICFNMCGLNYIGKELSYTADLNTVNKDQRLINMAGILQFLDRDLSKVNDNELIINYTSYICNLCFTLFHRVEDAKFNSKEKEFRIIYKVPTPINSLSGEICPNQERIFSLLIDGKNKYKGKTKIAHIDGKLVCCDMELTAVNALIAARETSLIAEVRKGKNFNILSEFKDIDIRDSVKRYGYIGNKEDCLAFINDELDVKKQHLT